MLYPLKILIAPLDWGLGHTTRCIPVIHYLLQSGHEVYVAGEGASARLIRDNFPDIMILPLKGYRIRYGRTKRSFSAALLLQIPKLIAAIRYEHKWLRQQQKRYKFDAVISDNRYGLHHRGISCAMMTHQLQIKSGINSRIDDVLRFLHYRLLLHFDQCWIVDEALNGGLSGELAHPSTIPHHATYVGVLSQFSVAELVAGPARAGIQAKPVILILLSGPEPMRSTLESLILGQISRLSGFRFVIVGGNPMGANLTGLEEHITYHSHLNAAALSKVIYMADLVVCRSGYSTLMDLVVMGKRALLIPTPGQPEQEYLAAYLKSKNMAYSCTQSELEMSVAISKALLAPPIQLQAGPWLQQMKVVVAGFLH